MRPPAIADAARDPRRVATAAEATHPTAQVARWGVRSAWKSGRGAQSWGGAVVRLRPARDNRLRVYRRDQSLGGVRQDDARRNDREQERRALRGYHGPEVQVRVVVFLRRLASDHRMDGRARGGVVCWTLGADREALRLAVTGRLAEVGDAVRNGRRGRG